MDIAALYLHVPFCHAKCAYCDFFSRACSPTALEQQGVAYVERLCCQIDALGTAGALAGVRTVYIGGGTPTVLGEGLVDIVCAVRRWADPIEFSVEANPESLDDALAVALATAGVTRVSLGVHSLDDTELKRVGRIHTAAEALAAITRAKRCGMDVSADLMCGLPGQTTQSWSATLERLIAADPDHVSVYPLTVEEGTPLARACEADSSLEPDEDFQATCMEEAAYLLGKAGFARYEVASYARPGKECRHNEAYWTGLSYLGLGPAAASMLDRASYDALREVLGLPAALDDAARIRFAVDERAVFATEVSETPRCPSDSEGAGRAGDVTAIRFAFEGAIWRDVEFLNAREAIAEDLMLGMRLVRGVDSDLIDAARAVCGTAAVDAVIAAAQDAGLARWFGADAEATPDTPQGMDTAREATEAAHANHRVPRSRFVPTQRGWLLGNELYGLMWDLAG